MFYGTVGKLKRPTSTTMLILFGGTSVILAVTLAGVNYLIKGPLMSAAGGKSASPSYQAAATVGQGVQGNASSPSFQTQSGATATQSAVIKSAPALNLTGAYVYPNPFKPGSGGKFDAQTITFKKLTNTATIKIYTYAGQLIKTIDKTDTSIDYYTWDAKNDEGENIASGVYIYLIKDSNGEKATGKFGIIR